MVEKSHKNHCFSGVGAYSPVVLKCMVFQRVQRFANFRKFYFPLEHHKLYPTLLYEIPDPNVCGGWSGAVFPQDLTHRNLINKQNQHISLTKQALFCRQKKKFLYVIMLSKSRNTQELSYLRY